MVGSLSGVIGEAIFDFGFNHLFSYGFFLYS